HSRLGGARWNECWGRRPSTEAIVPSGTVKVDSIMGDEHEDMAAQAGLPGTDVGVIAPQSKGPCLQDTVSQAGLVGMDAGVVAPQPKRPCLQDTASQTRLTRTDAGVVAPQPKRQCLQHPSHPNNPQLSVATHVEQMSSSSLNTDTATQVGLTGSDARVVTPQPKPPCLQYYLPSLCPLRHSCLGGAHWNEYEGRHPLVEATMPSGTAKANGIMGDEHEVCTRASLEATTRLSFPP
ncbi:hypothetical protein Ancab_031856, partial [Ancistrocladus abbreviatus]